MIWAQIDQVFCAVQELDRLYWIEARYICRTCGDLAYESQREPPHFRALRKVQKIRARLGGSANMTTPLPGRPRYMHRKTFENLMNQYEAAAEQYAGLIALRFQNRGGGHYG